MKALAWSVWISCVIGCGATLPEGAAVERHGLRSTELDGMLIGGNGADPTWLGQSLHRAPPGSPLSARVSVDQPCSIEEQDRHAVDLRTRFEGRSPVPDGEEGQRLLEGLGFSTATAGPIEVRYEMDVDRRVFASRGCGTGGFGRVTGLYHGNATLWLRRRGTQTTLESVEVEGWIVAQVHVAVPESAPSETPLGFVGPLGSNRQQAAEEARSSPEDRITLRPLRDNFELLHQGISLTENQFIRRYRQRTGSTELDSLYGDRRPWVVPLAATGFLLFGGLTALSIYAFATDDSEAPGGGPSIIAGVFYPLGALISGFLAIASGVVTVWGLLGEFFDAEGWRMHESDARVLVNVYNENN